MQIWLLVNDTITYPDAVGSDGISAAIGETLRKQIDSGDIKLPGHGVANAPYMEIKRVVERRLNGWVKSALLARTLRLNNEYIVAGRDKPAVVVVDKGTGVEQAGVKWSQGLHQFIQLKHGLEVSPESLKAVFMSNLFFFRGYKNQLFGLSGTLGSEIEQNCLTTLFQVELFKTPRAHGEQYVQKRGIVTGDRTTWCDAIT
ncbi:MAG: hypothetical protein EOO38_33000, partial [Cytophagaceae bacterium]